MSMSNLEASRQRVNPKPYDTAGPDEPTKVKGFITGYGKYKTVPNSTWRLLHDHGPVVFSVYLYLFRHSWGYNDNGNTTRRSFDQIAKGCHIGRKQARETVNLLIDVGLVRKLEVGHRRANEYLIKILHPDTFEAPGEPETETVRGSERTCNTKVRGSERTYSLETNSLKETKGRKETKAHPTPQLESSQKPEAEPSIETEIVGVLVDWGLGDRFHRQNLQGRTPEKQRLYVQRNHEKIVSDYERADGDTINDLRSRLGACRQWGHRVN